MAWPKGKRRGLLIAEFARAVCALSSIRSTARAIGISERQLRRIVAGKHACSHKVAVRLAEYALRGLRSGALPLYDPDMALDGNTRVGGVSEYSIRAARGDIEYVARTIAFSQEEG